MLEGGPAVLWNRTKRISTSTTSTNIDACSIDGLQENMRGRGIITPWLPCHVWNADESLATEHNSIKLIFSDAVILDVGHHYLFDFAHLRSAPLASVMGKLFGRVDTLLRFVG